MRRLIFVLCLTGLGSIAHAQTIPSFNPDEAQLARCFELVRNDPAQSQTIALQILKQPGVSPRNEVQALSCLAFARQLTGDREGSAEATDGILGLADSARLTDAEQVQARVATFSMLQSLGRVNDALEQMTKTYALAEQTGDRSAQMVALLGTGHIHAVELGNTEQSLGYFQQVRELAPPGTRLQMDGAYAHAYSLMVLARHAEARPELEQILVQAQRMGERGMILRVRSHLAEIKRIEGELDAARAEFETLQREQRELGDPAGEAVTRLRLARVHMQRGELEEARLHADYAMARMEDRAFELELMDALQLRAAIHEAAGEPAAALPLLRRERDMATSRVKRHNLAQLAVLQDTVADVTRAHRDETQRTEVAQANRRRDLALMALAMVIVLVGVLSVYQRRTHRHLRHLSATDPLTGLLNRREMLRRLAALPAPADGQRMLLLLIDVDHFKSINTRHGHAEGDTVLAAISTWLTEACDAGDLVARWGGEEFLVARPATDLDGAARFAEHVRAGVRDGSVVLDDGQRVSATVSIGAAPVPFFPGDAPHLPAGIRIADSALRAVKGSGRDGWAVLWGHAAGVSDATLASVEHDPMRAADNGWLRIQSSRPLQWPPRALAAAALGDNAPG